QQIHQAQVAFARPVRLAEMRRNHTEHGSGTADQRRGLHGPHAGLEQYVEQGPSGEDLALGHVFDSYPLDRLQGHAARRGFSLGDGVKKIRQRLLEPLLRRDLERAFFGVEQLDIAFVGSGNLDGGSEDFLEALLEVISSPYATLTDLTKARH